MKYLSIIFFFLTLSVHSQTALVKLSVIDQQTQSTLDSVQFIFSNQDGQSLVSGMILSDSVLEIELNNAEKLQISLTKEGFYALDTLIDISRYKQKIKRKKLIHLSLPMVFDGQYTAAFDINAQYKPAIEFSSDRISVTDYVVRNEQDILLLAYPKRLEKSSELIWFKNEVLYAKIKAPAGTYQLDVDYQNKIYLRTKYSDYLVNVNEDLTISPIEKGYYQQYLAPIIDTNRANQLFFDNYQYHYPAFDFFKVNLLDTQHVLLHSVVDDEMMEHYRAEYKWADVRTKLWAWDKESETGIDREIWIGANVFAHSIYYEDTYGELFVLDDEVVVFDFYTDYLYFYHQRTGEAIDSVLINFHKNSRQHEWERRVVQDPITKKIYTFYDDGGYLDVFEINMSTGELKTAFTLFYRYAENIQIYNDRIYYVYRPFESLQKKYLYSEDLSNENRDLSGQNRFENSFSK
ncbi:hypothetical protein CW751_09915 [Brumimicrobium salinarum]|uniref:DUF5103 domain-containing protein n=1 Tax=Brumimicrobium salinarum TaxID=2058658 RepID=A0A2I0R1D1_9FLAO|nr:hypothetical protein [Brumimicrobium salinarum]PKR80379.1 hypothetical protein CW751_09915 [Brumimicrobium salinarum]